MPRVSKTLEVSAKLAASIVRLADKINRLEDINRDLIKQIDELIAIEKMDRAIS